MPRNSAASTASEMLSGLKTRLGFARSEDEEFSRYDADFNSYDDFDDDGYSPRYDNEYAGYGADYDESAPVGAYRPASTRSGRFGHGDSTPNLVSIDDVKARAQTSSASTKDSPSSSGSVSSRRTANRDLIGPSGPAPSSPAHNASLRESQSRSEGLNSLFESTSKNALSESASTANSKSSSPYRSTSSYDLYEKTSTPAATSATRASARAITVIKPVSYSDAERVARALKSGDVVVLSMRSTADDLSKRILDFSFGAATALDASVECPTEKVFAIARGMALSVDEKARLRSQGVL